TIKQSSQLNWKMEHLKAMSRKGCFDMGMAHVLFSSAISMCFQVKWSIIRQMHKSVYCWNKIYLLCEEILKDVHKNVICNRRFILYNRKRLSLNLSSCCLGVWKWRSYRRFRHHKQSNPDNP